MNSTGTENFDLCKNGPMRMTPNAAPQRTEPLTQHRKMKATDAAGARMLDCALAQIHERGLAVTIDRISFEDIIKEAGVSRATAYRKWPSRQAFLADVVSAAVQRVEFTTDGLEDIRLLRPLLDSGIETWEDPQQRRNATVTGLRMVTQADFERILASPGTDLYYGLTATCRGLRDDAVRENAQNALRSAAVALVSRRANVFRGLPSMLGYRLIPGIDPDGGFELLAEASGAMGYGLAIAAFNDPDFATRTFRVAAWGSTAVEEWTHPAYHLVGLIFSYFEPDPDVVWNSERIAHLSAILDELGSVAENGARDGAESKTHLDVEGAGDSA